MANPSGDKGTAGETAVARWFRDNGFGHADRLTKTGNHDRGDVLLTFGVMAEVKNHKLPTGIPTAGQLAQWMRETEVERANGRHDVAVLIVKRPGTTDVGRWFAYVTAHTLSELVAGTSQAVAPIDLPALTAPACMTVADLSQLLRAAGWGDELEEAS